MITADTLLLSRRDVADLLSLDDCMNAVEFAFRSYAEGTAPAPSILGVHVSRGGFHIKAGTMNLRRNYFVAKVNANFPGNTTAGLPTIQGVIVVSDADDGRLLAVMDSMELTIIRTGAATGVAAKYLARKDAKTVTICGCGNQGRISLRALARVRRVEEVHVFDVDNSRSREFAKTISAELGLGVSPVSDLRAAVKRSDICITCTPSRAPLLFASDIAPGTFIGAVGADSEQKQEIDPSLIAASKLVADVATQSATIGDFHHALESGVVNRSHLYAELGEIIAGKKDGRVSEEEIIVFDSTGMALQDVVSASIVFEKALEAQPASGFDFGK